MAGKVAHVLALITVEQRQALTSYLTIGLSTQNCLASELVCASSNMWKVLAEVLYRPRLN